MLVFCAIGQLAPGLMGALYQLHDREIFQNKIWILLRTKRESQSVPSRVSWNTNKSTKELQDQRKGRRYLRKNTEAEFAANPYSNVSAL